MHEFGATTPKLWRIPYRDFYFALKIVKIHQLVELNKRDGVALYYLQKNDYDQHDQRRGVGIFGVYSSIVFTSMDRNLVVRWKFPTPEGVTFSGLLYILHY